MAKYGEKTYNSGNPLQRFSHRTRFRVALRLLEKVSGSSVLDYGCGDGKLLHMLHDAGGKTDLWGFEPVMEVPVVEGVTVVKELSAVPDDRKFDIVCCFEVFEHFNERYQKEMIDNIAGLLEPEGHLVLSVPIEVGLPSLVKNLVRKSRHPGSALYTNRNVWGSAFGNAPQDMRQQEGYLSHMGFDHHRLEKLLDEKFVRVKKRFSPFRGLGGAFNSQVFYVLRKA